MNKGFGGGGCWKRGLSSKVDDGLATEIDE